MKIRPGKGILKKKRSFQTPGNTLSGGSVMSLGISEGKITKSGKQKKLKDADYVPNSNSQWFNSPDACIPQ